ncbi:MAG: lysoplasmalogenase family protein [Novosphingobium sp.]
MPERALIEKRPWLLASLLAGISYFFVRHSAVPGLYLMVWKGTGVALLAAYALTRHKGADSRQIAAVMGFGALGDMLIEFSLEAGAAAFLVGHLIAIHLYLRHRRARIMPSQHAFGIALALLTPLIAYSLTLSPLVALYALALGVMAGTAWTSSFLRYSVGIGAVMFVASDLLIFARMGPMAESALPDLLIWPLYYFGQFLICTGVIGELRHRSMQQ